MPVIRRKRRTIHASLLLDSVDSIRNGGDSGIILQPGDPDTSLIFQSLVGEEGLQMPPEGRLSVQQIQDVKQWIIDGALMPAGEASRGLIKGEIDYDAYANFWSFTPLVMPALPEGEWVLHGLSRGLIILSSAGSKVQVCRRIQ